MPRTLCLLAAAAFLCLPAGVASAADVVVKGVHVCCGACVTGVKEALEDVEGVTDAGADANTKTVAFKAKDEAAAKAGVEALAKAGFHGEATLDKQPLAFPTPKIEKGAKADSITVTGVHLCCGACVTGVKKALEDVKGANEMKIDRDAKTVSVSGKDISVEEFFAALFKAGYHGELKK